MFIVKIWLEEKGKLQIIFHSLRFMFALYSCFICSFVADKTFTPIFFPVCSLHWHKTIVPYSLSGYNNKTNRTIENEKIASEQKGKQVENVHIRTRPTIHRQ